jgi:hypothetical protein
MEDRFYVRLTNEEQIAEFMKEFEHKGLLNIKARLGAHPGMSLKETMISEGRWESFSKSIIEFGHDPEEEVVKLEKKAREVE